MQPPLLFPSSLPGLSSLSKVPLLSSKLLSSTKVSKGQVMLIPHFCTRWRAYIVRIKTGELQLFPPHNHLPGSCVCLAVGDKGTWKTLLTISYLDLFSPAQSSKRGGKGVQEWRTTKGPSWKEAS